MFQTSDHALVATPKNIPATVRKPAPGSNFNSESATAGMRTSSDAGAQTSGLGGSHRLPRLGILVKDAKSKDHACQINGRVADEKGTTRGDEVHTHLEPNAEGSSFQINGIPTGNAVKHLAEKWGKSQRD